jgi:hypothetical protein
MAEEVTPEVISAGMAVASIIAEALDKLHTRTDALIGPFLAASRFLQSHLEVAAWRSREVQP